MLKTRLVQIFHPHPLKIDLEAGGDEEKCVQSLGKTFGSKPEQTLLLLKSAK